MSKEQIGIRFEPSFVKRIDEAAEVQRMPTRTAFIEYHLKKAVNKILKKELGYDIDTES